MQGNLFDVRPRNTKKEMRITQSLRQMAFMEKRTQRLNW